MSEFTTIRNNIQTNRQRHRDQERIKYEVEQALLKIEEKIAEFTLIGEAIPDFLIQEQQRLKGEIELAQSVLAVIAQELESSYQAFYELGEPQTLVSQLDDAIPFLLMPLKLEIRFVTVKHFARKFERGDVLNVQNLGQIPDHFTIQTGTYTNDSTIEIPSLPLIDAQGNDQLVSDVKRVIKRGEFAPAGGDWLKRVEDKQELWIRIYPDDFFLHSHEKALTEAEWLAGKTYWNTYWQAEITFQTSTKDEIATEERRNSLLEAWRSICSGFSIPRAKWIIKASEPTNFNQGNPDLNSDPGFPDISTKSTAWTEAPGTYILPDHFGVRLFSGTTYREVTGNPLPHHVMLGLDPSDPTDDLFSLSGEGMKLSEGLRWVADFEVAEKKGLALRVPVTTAEFNQGFDKMVVLGLRLSSDPKDGQKLLEEQLYNHQYKDSGLSILPQGTPTNSIDKKKNADDVEQLEATAFEKWGAGEGLFSKEITPLQKKDGQYLADFLGVDEALFQKVLHSDFTDMQEAQAMNHLLWPATLGYYLEQFLFPLISEKDSEQTRAFFTKFVAGRGMMPSLRVNNQPYGIIPSTSFSKWTYSDEPENDFYRRLYQRVLSVLDKQWDSLASKVIHAADPSTPGNPFNDRVMQLLGLHANSVDFYVRSLVDYFFSEDVMNASVTIDSKYWEIRDNLKSAGFYFENFEEPTRIFDMLFSKEVRTLDGPLIDSLPLSEKRKLQKLEGTETSYLDWLEQADVLEEIKSGTIDLDTTPGLPLLYLLLRQAILRAYINAAIRLLIEAGKISPVAKVDQEREETSTNRQPGANHKFVLRSAIKLKWQHAIKHKTEELYDILISEGVNINSINAFEQGLFSAFDFFNSNDFLRQTVEQAIRKLRIRLIPQPLPTIVKDAIGDFIKDVDEAIKKGVALEYEDTVSDVLFEPDKWKLLSEKYEEVSGTQDMLSYIEEQLNANPPAAIRHLTIMKSAFQIIKDLPTARLERLLTEHLDLCSYRLDAWLLGLVHQRLFQQRKVNEKGIYLGAFGYLRDVRPGSVPGLSVQEIKPHPLHDFTGNMPNLDQIVIPLLNFAEFEAADLDLDQLLPNAFIYLGGSSDSCLYYHEDTKQIIPRPRVDTHSEGLIHTPSLAHASTAAILRSGYATYNAYNPNPSALDPYAVNLSSARVRKALYYLEGIRNGQELGALLGYQLERALHSYVDQKPINVSFVENAMGYLLQLRQHFPLKTSTTGSDILEEAFYVTDGLALLNKVKNQPPTAHWSAGILQNCPAAHLEIIDKEVKKLEESLDALSDLLMAESVYQMAKGNATRSAAALRALDSGSSIPDIEVINTPTRGFTYTQRLGIQMDASQSNDLAWNTKKSTRASVNPVVNQWLRHQVPAPNTILVNVGFADGEWRKFSLDQSDLQPADLIYLLSQENYEAPESELSIRIREYFREANNLGVEETLIINYCDREGFTRSEYSIFELMPLMSSLAAMLQAGRPLLPEDLVVPSEVNQAGQLLLEGLKSRLIGVLNQNEEGSLNQVLQTLQSAFEALEADDGGQQDLYDALFFALLESSSFNLPAAIPRTSRQASLENRTILLLQAKAVLPLLQKKKAEAQLSLERIDDAENAKEELEVLTQLGQLLFGRGFKVFPEFELTKPNQLSKALANPELFKDMDDFVVEEWLQGLTLVRNPVKMYTNLTMLRETFSASHEEKQLDTVQLPYGNAPWIANSRPQGNLISGDTLSLAIELPDNYDPTKPQLGIILDEWKEFIPDKTTNTGVTFNYNQPNTEAPQALLLAVTPEITGSWQWDDLMATVVETMDLAKKRAVDPDLIKESQLAHFLPAILGPINDQDLYPSLDFAQNIKS